MGGNNYQSFISFKVFYFFLMHGSLKIFTPPLFAHLVSLQFTADITLLVGSITGTIFSCSISTTTTKK